MSQNSSFPDPAATRVQVVRVHPVGQLGTPKETVVYLADPTQHATQVDTALTFWESLLNSESGKNGHAGDGSDAAEAREDSGNSSRRG